MSEKLIDIEQVELNNNCPECYSKDGLRLAFKQKMVENKLYKCITSDITHEITCFNCNSIIYPVRWTDDIERVFEYQKKAFTPQKSSLRFKKMFWITVIGIIILIGLAAFATYYQFIMPS
ncbi:hypothetical protein [uncultured Algibacter sp.]|uniref:hypothetical protein n=1 Tax=uncultured Algibacter sp. TaxID=298659 RepID=UPI003216B9C3